MLLLVIKLTLQIVFIYLLKEVHKEFYSKFSRGGVAQMVERSLSMREVPGSIPGISKSFIQGDSNKGHF